MNAQPGQLTTQPGLATRILYIYLWLTMGLLFIQGSGSLLLRLRPDIESITPGLLATIMRDSWRSATSDAERLRVVVDQVAQLTDSAAMNWHRQLVRPDA